MYITAWRLFLTRNLYLLTLFISILPNPCPSDNHQFVLYIYEFASHFVCFVF